MWEFLRNPVAVSVAGFVFIAVLFALGIVIRWARIRKAGKSGLEIGESESVSEFSTYDLIAEGAEYLIVKRCMESVDRNHYADQIESAWLHTKDSGYAGMYSDLQAHVEDRWTSERVPVSVISEAQKAHDIDYYRLYVRMMERLRAISIETADKVAGAEMRIKEIKDSWKLDSENALILISDLVQAEMAKVQIPGESKDASRSVVREIAQEAVQMMRRYAHEAICKHLGMKNGGCKS